MDVEDATIDLTGGPLEVAARLLGVTLRVGPVAVRLTEVEGYAGADDPAAHAFGGWRPHRRHLFEPPGTLYCYLSHGLHICANIVCGPAGSGSAVLLRAGEVIEGMEIARARRGGVADVRLARGPGCLGQALGLTLADSGRRLGEPGLSVVAGPRPDAVSSGPRVGVSVAHQRPWRFWVTGDPTVSAYRASPRIDPARPGW